MRKGMNPHSRVAHQRVSDPRFTLSDFLISWIPRVLLDVDKENFAVIVAYAALCVLTYNQDIRPPANVHASVVSAMLFLRDAFGFDPVIFVAGSDSLENSWAIVQPILSKLIDVMDFSVGGTFIKIAVSRGILRLLGLDPYFARALRRPQLMQIEPLSG